MIELRKVHMHACMLRVRDLVSARGLVSGGGRVYEIKILRSNLAPEEGGGRLFEGGV